MNCIYVSLQHPFFFKRFVAFVTILIGKTTKEFGLIVIVVLNFLMKKMTI